MSDDAPAVRELSEDTVERIAAGGAERVVLAVPVAPPDTLSELGTKVDEVVCVEAPSQFGAVGRFYRTFDQVTDERARSYLVDDAT